MWFLGAYGPESKSKPMKIDNEKIDKKKDSKVPANGWRKAHRMEKKHTIYKTASEVIEESKHPGQRKREFKYNNFICHLNFIYML